jgi:hypothetical protein
LASSPVGRITVTDLRWLIWVNELKVGPLRAMKLERSLPTT